MDDLNLIGFDKEFTYRLDKKDKTPDVVQEVVIKHISNQLIKFNRILFHSVLLRREKEDGVWYQAGVQIEYNSGVGASYESKSISAGTVTWTVTEEGRQVVVKVNYDPNKVHEYKDPIDEVKPH